MTLKLSGGPSPSSNSSFSTLTVPPSGVSEWITFQGDFGSELSDVWITYFDQSAVSMTYPCSLDAANALELERVGSVSSTSVLCRTATGEPAGSYSIQVMVSGQASNPSLDQLEFIQVPVLTNLTGCPELREGGTFGCATRGGDQLTLSGSGFSVQMMVTLNGKACTNVTTVNDSYATCTVPAGTGATVSVLLHNEDLVSVPYLKLGYAAPHITVLYHDACTSDPETSLKLKACLREGGGTLTITGQDFGIEGAVAIVGS